MNSNLFRYNQPVNGFRDLRVGAVISRVGAPDYGVRNPEVSRQQVAHNIQAFARQYRLRLLATAVQVHGSTMLKVDGDYPIGVPEQRADALTTNQPGIGVGVLTADCVPVLVARYGLSGLVQQVFAIHAGRRGIADGIVTKSLAGIAPETLQVWLGPAICRDCYEIDAATAGQCTEAGFAATSLIATRNGRYLCDLKAEVMRQLVQLGVTAIVNQDQCTRHTLDNCTRVPAWYSHRNGDARRMLSAIWLRSETEAAADAHHH